MKRLRLLRQRLHMRRVRQQKQQPTIWFQRYLRTSSRIWHCTCNQPPTETVLQWAERNQKRLEKIKLPSYWRSAALLLGF